MFRTQRRYSDLERSRYRKDSQNIGSMQNPENSFDEKTANLHMKRVISHQMTLQNNARKTADDLISETFSLIKHFYGKQESYFYVKVKSYLREECQKQKRKINEHLDKLVYLGLQSQKENYHEIQLQIISEWRKNPLLYKIRKIWYQFIAFNELSSMSIFQQQYEKFRDLVGQLTYHFFKSFFLSIHQEDEVNALIQKLTIRTSHMIITNSKSWQQICVHIVKPLWKDLNKDNIKEKRIFDDCLSRMGIQSIIIDIGSDLPQMPKTVQYVRRFLCSWKILEKIQYLQLMRKAMEEEIMQKQKQMIKKGTLKHVKLLDKDDIIDILLYCIVYLIKKQKRSSEIKENYPCSQKSENFMKQITGSFSLTEVQFGIKYFGLLINNEVDSILSKFKCQTYLADLEAIYQFIISFDFNAQQLKQQ